MWRDQRAASRWYDAEMRKEAFHQQRMAVLYAAMEDPEAVGQALAPYGLDVDALFDVDKPFPELPKPDVG